MTKFVLSLFVAFFAFAPATAQSAKSFLRSAKKMSKELRWENAVEACDQAIALDPSIAEAYAVRGGAYEQLDSIALAAADYATATTYDKKEKAFFYHAGRLHNELGEYKKAVNFLHEATKLDKKYILAYHEKIDALMALRDFHMALGEAKLALEAGKSAKNYYNQAHANDSLHNYEAAAEDYKRAMRSDKKMEEAYVGYGFALIRMAELEKATETCEKLLEINPENTGAYFCRSRVQFEKGYFSKAILDLSMVTKLEPENVHALMKRAALYQELNQHANAVVDYNQVLKLEPKHYAAYYMRAKSFEALNQLDKAIEDYETLRQLAPYDSKIAALHQKSIEKLYELHREENAPEFFFTIPREQSNEKQASIQVHSGLDVLEVSGWVKDQSHITHIKINGVEAKYDAERKNPEICTKLNVAGMTSFEVEVLDVYDNVLRKTYQIEWTEVNPPVVKLIAPVASDVGEIYLDSDEPLLYIEGRITDESLIGLILVEGANASYVADRQNPVFTANIDISNKSEITIRVEDVFGNETVNTYTLNREGALLSAENPMGKTWVVFVQNSNYENFASLEGPAKDVTIMRSVLSNYEIHNLIVKQDMTSEEMERFFSIELRDMVRSNHVNSILIWYAGHGKFINDIGYWIPVDAKRDDEFSYFNINELKASLQGFSRYLTHTLVITDACESGPSFLQAMRSTDPDRRCDDYTATAFKSSQVFSSAGYEVASDLSQFTKTFANTLQHNPNYCIPIDQIVNDVSSAVSHNTNQRAQFGTIQGLEDENGTFFFVRKKQEAPEE